MEKAIDDYRLGEDHEELTLETLDDNAAVIDAMVGQARRMLQIFSRDMEPRLYDREAFYQLLRRFAISSRNVEVQILIMNSDRMVKDRHRLVDLARRLSSYIHFRRLADDYQDIPSSFVIVDERGYLYRSLAVQYEGVADFNNPYRSQELSRQFDELWQHSTPDPNLRRLHI